MSLRDKITKRSCQHRDVTVDGDVYRVVELSRRGLSAIRAGCRTESGVDIDKLEAELLSECVRDPDGGGCIMTAAEWDDVPALLCTRLSEQVLAINGLTEGNAEGE